MKKILLSLTLVIGILLSEGLVANAYSGYHFIESEDNNTIETADYFRVYNEDRYVYGIVGQNDTRDYFKFTANEEATMDIYFRFDKDKASSDIDIDVMFYNSSGQFLKSFSNCNGYVSYTVELKRDDFIYMCIDQDIGYLTEPYTIRFDMD